HFIWSSYTLDANRRKIFAVICMAPFAICHIPFAMPSAVAAEMPSPVPSKSTVTLPDTNLTLSPETSAIEEGKALYENGQLIAALGKFMTVLRKDPHNNEARQYL